jgi:hypothetical protein
MALTCPESCGEVSTPRCLVTSTWRITERQFYLPCAVRKDDESLFLILEAKTLVQSDRLLKSQAELSEASLHALMGDARRGEQALDGSTQI